MNIEQIATIWAFVLLGVVLLSGLVAVLVGVWIQWRADIRDIDEREQHYMRWKGRNDPRS